MAGGFGFQTCMLVEPYRSHVRCLHGNKSELWNVATSQPASMVVVVLVGEKHGGWIQSSFVTWLYLGGRTPLSTANHKPYSWQCGGNIQEAQPTFLISCNPHTTLFHPRAPHTLTTTTQPTLSLDVWDVSDIQRLATSRLWNVNTVFVLASPCNGSWHFGMWGLW